MKLPIVQKLCALELRARAQEMKHTGIYRAPAGEPTQTPSAAWVHVALWYIFGPYSSSYVLTFGPMYVYYIRTWTHSGDYEGRRGALKRPIRGYWS